jgi:enamine deaminase RidA (YjgF/YER057c/UK114 family)
MAKDFINPQALPNWKEVFSQVIAVSSNASKTIYISGQVSVDKEKNLIGEGDLRLQAMQAFQNL